MFGARPKFKSNTNLKFFYFLSPFLVTAAVVGTIGAGGAVVAAPFVLGAVGFTAVGITAGSWAAGMMSSAAAVANGGAVAAGTTVAVLQSVGAAGLGAVATAATASGGAAAALALKEALESAAT
uniref:Uncharacterized protein n=1 Tax=Gadus morhua TaxID=8049 RepID=A0A8C5C525_GADMO